MYTKTDAKPVENVWGNYQRPEFYFILGPKNWTFEAHIFHTFKSTCNEHVKQYWCETSENILRKWPKSIILTYFGVQMVPKLGLKIVHISESSFNEHIKQDLCESRGYVLTNIKKNWILTHLEA